MAPDGAFNEIDTESSESIAIGDHNIDDAVAFDEFQKGEEAFSLEVEARGNIGDDFVMARPFLFEEVDLALEVARFFLFGGRDSGVEDGESVTVIRFFVCGNTKTGAQVSIVVSMSGVMSTSDAETADFAIFSPGCKSGSRDAILLNDKLWRNIFI